MKKILNSQDLNTLQGVIASLMYLNQEAKREGLETVAKILKESITAISNWMDGKQTNFKQHELLDHSMYNSLMFLVKMISLPSKEQTDLAKILENIEQISLHKTKIANLC